MDMSGKMVVSKEYESNDNPLFQDQLDVSPFVPGMYILQVVTTTGMLTEKISIVD
jgi:3-hydroxymyristoyl/3-hydroxydecanoyl-(acyl carrier protein) dehydratase